MAIIYPILYCLIDGLGTFLDGYYLETKKIMSEDQALISYEMTFFIVGMIALVYLLLVKGQRFSFSVKKIVSLRPDFETLGQFFYVGAIASNAIVVAPMISSYSIVSVILSRIFLKEKLTTKQYAVIAMIMVAIAILGFMMDRSASGTLFLSLQILFLLFVIIDIGDENGKEKTSVSMVR